MNQSKGLPLARRTVLAGAALAAVQAGAQATERAPGPALLNVAAISPDAATQQALEALAAQGGIALRIVRAGKGDAARRALHAAAAGGARLVVAGEAALERSAIRIAALHRDVAVLASHGGTAGQANLSLHLRNATQTAIRRAGIAAGLSTQSGKTGVLFSHATPEARWALAAFTLGVRIARPDAEVLVHFTNSARSVAVAEAGRALLAARGADAIHAHLLAAHAPGHPQELWQIDAALRRLAAFALRETAGTVQA